MELGGFEEYKFDEGGKSGGEEWKSFEGGEIKGFEGGEIKEAEEFGKWEEFGGGSSGGWVPIKGRK